MDDARELQYGIGFDTGEAESTIDNLTGKVDELEQQLRAAEMGAQRFGAGTISACNSGRDGILNTVGALNEAADAFDDTAQEARNAGDVTRMFGQDAEGVREALRGVSDEALEAGASAQRFGAAAQGAGDALDGASDSMVIAENAARDFGRSASEAGKAVDDVSDGARNAGNAMSRFARDADDASDEADDFRASIRKAAEEADSLKGAFRTTMADGLEAGRSIAKSFGTGVTGAIDFSSKKVKTFVAETIKGAKNIGSSFKSPIKTIRTNLIDALRKAAKAEKEVGDEANDAERDLKDMGDAGEQAGNDIKEAISGAIGAFVGFEAISQGIELLKEFGAAATEAFSATENTAAKFDRTFSDEAAAWVENYSDAVKRSSSEVQGFMVQNQAMYRNLGITAEAAEGLSEITTSLAYDFGNAFKMEDAEALSLLQGAIQGDTAALTEYGIILDETALKQSAAALGLGSNLEALDDAAAAQVRLNAILAQSSDIQQAAINSTGGLVNSTKSLNGVWSEFLSDSGEKFAPAVENLTNAVIESWPELEPMLLSFVDVLAGGLNDAVPVLVELGKELIPALSSGLSVLMDIAGPLVGIVGELAGSTLPPLASVFGDLATYALPPLIDLVEELNAGVIQPLMPVVEELSSQLLPVLGMALSSVASTVSPLISAFVPLLTTILPPLGEIVSELALAVIPPLTQAIQVVTTALLPVVDIATTLLQSVLPLAEPLLTVISTILSSVLLPAVEALSPVLNFVSDTLGVIAGWVSDIIGFFAGGVGKVADWFAGLFGGAEKSVSEVENLGKSINSLSEAAENVPSPEIVIPEPDIPDFPDIPKITVPVEPAVTDIPDLDTPDFEPVVIPVKAEKPEIPEPDIVPVKLPVFAEKPEIPRPDVEPVDLPVTVQKPVIPSPDIFPVEIPVSAEKPTIPVPDIFAVELPVTAQKATIPKPDVEPVEIPVSANKPEIPAPDVVAVELPVTVEKPEIPQPDVKPVEIPVTAQKPEIPHPDIFRVEIPVSAEKPIVPEPDVVPVHIPVFVEKPEIPAPDVEPVIIPVSVDTPIVPEPVMPVLESIVLPPADTGQFVSSVNAAVSDVTQVAESGSGKVFKSFAGAMQNSQDAAAAAFDSIASVAENAWRRMVSAAENGARLIVSNLQSVAAAGQSISNTRLSISNAKIPGHADGTEHFEGGWTRMNEEGGELAYLPSGTAIIPADKTDEIINNTSTSSSEYVDNSTFSPQISVTMSGGGDPDEADAMAEKLKSIMEQFWREKKEEEYHHRAMQGAFAR